MARRGTGLLAVLALVLTSFFVLSSAANAAPGDATITATPNSGLGTVQVVSLSGNAGPLSTRPDTTYPALHLAMCRLPLTATSCDTSLTNYGQPVTGNPATDPYIVDVTPDASGNWGPVNFLVRKTIVNGDGRFQCGSGVNQCVIGSANSPRPTDHSYDAIQNLSFASSSLTYPTAVADLQSITLTGSNFPLQTASASDATPTTQGVYTFQCALPLGPSSCDGNPGHYGVATVSTLGAFSSSFTVRKTFTDQGAVVHNCAVESCIVATIKNPPGAPDGYSVYGSGTFTFSATLSISSITGQTVTTAARSGDTLSFAGSNFGAGLSGGTVEQCDITVTTCSALAFTGASVSSNSAGDLTASSAVVSGSATVGSTVVRVTLGTKSATVSLTVLGAPTLSASPPSAGSGVSRAISGSNWNPGSSVQLTTVVSSGSPECVSTVVATSSGDLPPSSCTPSNTGTTSLSATSGALSASFALVVTGDDCQAQVAGTPNTVGCSLFENVDLTVLAGDLHLYKIPGRVAMSTVTLNGHQRSSTGSLRDLQVVDARGGVYGWSLTGVMSALTEPSGVGNSSIPASNMSWTPACGYTAPVASGQGTVQQGLPASLGATATLCSVASGQTGGDFSADAALSLTVPAFSNAGAYTGTITLTLI